MPGKPGEKLAIFGEKGMRLVRSWETLMILAESAEPLTSKQLHERIHRIDLFSRNACSLQTIIEDLKTLQKCGFPVERVDAAGKVIDQEEMDSIQGKMKGTKWQLRDPAKLGDFSSPVHKLPTASNIVALSLCRALLQDVVPYQYPLHLSVAKILEELQLRLNRQLRIGEGVTIDLYGKIMHLGRQYVGKSVTSETWNRITTAIAQKHVLVGNYVNRDSEIREVDIAPLAVWFSEGRAYVLAAGATDKKVRAWRIDRLSEFSVAHGRIAPDIEEEVIESTLKHSFKGYISDSVGVCLNVKPEAAYLFREFQYHSTQQVIENSDGSLNVSMECASGWGLEEWILGFGELVIVTEPEELRARLRDRMRQVYEMYCVTTQTSN